MYKYFIVCILLLTNIAYANTSDWQEIEDKAKGQTVYFHAWGGSNEINSYLRWASKQLKNQFDIDMKHVKVADISQTISRLRAEKTAGNDDQGSIDMVWINGENFKTMKHQDLITTAFTHSLPNWQYIDKTFPVESDFTEPTDGLEAPWGIGQLVFIYDKKRMHQPPNSFKEMLIYAQQNPNRLSYPRPPAFHGTSFLKSILLELSAQKEMLYKPVQADTFQQISKPLWNYLDAFHKVSWQSGKRFPANSTETIQLLDDGQIDFAITFNPNEVTTAQNNGNLSESTEAFAMQSGALSNIHFLSIPWNATAKEGALVTINFLLSPEAQSHKGDLSIWGDPSILQSQYIVGSAKKTQLFKSIAEPHPSWQSALENEWQKRYGH